MRCVNDICTSLTCRVASECIGTPSPSCTVWACVAEQCLPGCFDGGFVDASPPRDGGFADAIVNPDATARDAVVGMDASQPADAVVPADTGMVDAGPPVDTGPPPDSGIMCDPTPRAPMAGELIANEIHADPAADLPGDANNDGTRSQSDDEFVEIVNIGTSVIQLDGVMVADADQVRHTFASRTLDCGKAIVIFGGGDPNHANWQSNWVVASTGRLLLRNAGDAIQVGTSTVNTSNISATTYGTIGGDDQSIVRETELTNSLNFVKHSEHPSSGGRRFSPGTRVDGNPF